MFVFACHPCCYRFNIGCNDLFERSFEKKVTNDLNKWTISLKKPFNWTIVLLEIERNRQKFRNSKKRIKFFPERLKKNDRNQSLMNDQRTNKLKWLKLIPQSSCLNNLIQKNFSSCTRLNCKLWRKHLYLKLIFLIEEGIKSSVVF